MKYYIKQKLWIRIALIVLIVACVAQITYSIAKIANLWGLESINMALDITTMVAMVLLVALTLALYLVRFRIANNKLTLKVLGFSLLASTIKIDNILNIVYYTNVNRLFIGYMEEDSTTNILHVNISSKKMPAFVAQLQELNQQIHYSEEIS